MEASNTNTNRESNMKTTAEAVREFEAQGAIEPGTQSEGTTTTEGAKMNETTETYSYSKWGRDYRLPMVHGVGGDGVMIVGTYLAPSVAIVDVDIYDEAYSEALEWMAAHHQLSPVNIDDDHAEDDGVEWVDGVGFCVTLDVVVYRSENLR